MTGSPLGRVLVAAGLVSLLAACGTKPPSASSAADSNAGHDTHTGTVMTALHDELGVDFQPAGPHHDLGKAPDGVQLDLIGIPVEEAVMSVPAGDMDAGLPYLVHLRDLLHGPARVYDWVATGLTCRANPEASCEQRYEQGNVIARFSDGGPDYVVVSISRGP